MQSMTVSVSLLLLAQPNCGRREEEGQQQQQLCQALLQTEPWGHHWHQCRGHATHFYTWVDLLKKKRLFT